MIFCLIVQMKSYISANSMETNGPVFVHATGLALITNRLTIATKQGRQYSYCKITGEPA
jgi:hypothetical protein